jgi:signal transduction histidine kinase
MRGLLRKQEIQMQPLDLNEAVADVLEIIAADARRRGVKLQFDPARGLPQVSGDRIHLQQVLLNLIVNAMDAMQATPESERELWVRTRLAARAYAEVSVVDRGCGIPPDKLPELFDSFFTTKPDGMGVGLSIARWIVLAHGGRIWAANGEQGGAEFRFTLRTVMPAGEGTRDLTTAGET